MNIKFDALLYNAYARFKASEFRYNWWKNAEIKSIKKNLLGKLKDD